VSEFTRIRRNDREKFNFLLSSEKTINEGRKVPGGAKTV